MGKFLKVVSLFCVFVFCALMLTMFILNRYIEKRDGVEITKTAIASTAPSLIEVRMTGTATLDDNRQLSVEGETNLPNGTELGLTVTNNVFSQHYFVTPVVKNNIFYASGIGHKEGLSIGNYIVEITTPLASLQPKVVQSIIGKNGQFMTGKLVKVDEFGDKSFAYVFPLVLGDSKEIEALEKKQLRKIKKIKSDIESLIVEGRAMEESRNYDIPACIKRMRQNQIKANAVRHSAESLKGHYFGLKSAASEVYFCITCTERSLAACNRTAEKLREIEQPLPF